MIIIGKSRIIQQDNTTKLVCIIKDTQNNTETEYYYSTPSEYGNYLVHEVADPFIYAAMLPAVMSGQDILCEAPVSERLCYNIINQLIYIISLANNKLVNNKPQIKVTVHETSEIRFDSFAVGCGCSLGVDSFAAMMSHFDNPLFPHYNITHLTYFNVGAHGYKNLEAVKKSYLKDLNRVQQFADSIHLPLVLIESNICKLFEGMNFDQTGNFINASTVLSMQKLFKTYLYGSNDPICEFKFVPELAGYYESMVFPLSSTPSTELVIANPTDYRSEKTKAIMNSDLTQKNLYVCWKELIVNNNPDSPIAQIIDNKLNCTRCAKCLRTCLQLDLYGVIDKYDSIFDLPHYYSVKEKYIADILSHPNKDAYYHDLNDMLKNAKNRGGGYTPTLKTRFYATAYKMHLPGIINRVKRLFGR